MQDITTIKTNWTAIVKNLYSKGRAGQDGGIKARQKKTNTRLKKQNTIKLKTQETSHKRNNMALIVAF